MNKETISRRIEYLSQLITKHEKEIAFLKDLFAVYDKHKAGETSTSKNHTESLHSQIVSEILNWRNDFDCNDVHRTLPDIPIENIRASIYRMYKDGLLTRLSKGTGRAPSKYVVKTK